VLGSFLDQPSPALVKLLEATAAIANGHSQFDGPRLRSCNLLGQLLPLLLVGIERGLSLSNQGILVSQFPLRRGQIPLGRHNTIGRCLHLQLQVSQFCLELVAAAREQPGPLLPNGQITLHLFHLLMQATALEVPSAQLFTELGLAHPQGSHLSVKGIQVFTLVLQHDLAAIQSVAGPT
jgi:hypothetical protein